MRKVSSLKERYEAKSIDIAASQTEPETRRNIDSQFAIVIMMFLILALIMAAVGGIGLMGSLSISVVERTREIGVKPNIIEPLTPSTRPV